MLSRSDVTVRDACAVYPPMRVRIWRNTEVPSRSVTGCCLRAPEKQRATRLIRTPKARLGLAQLGALRASGPVSDSARAELPPGEQPDPARDHHQDKVTTEHCRRTLTSDKCLLRSSACRRGNRV